MENIEQQTSPRLRLTSARQVIEHPEADGRARLSADRPREAVAGGVAAWEYDVRFKRMLAMIFREIKRRDFNKRHRLVAEWLVECTLAQGFCWMVGPSLEFLAGPLGLNRTEMHEILFGYSSGKAEVSVRVPGLVEMGLVRVRELAGKRGNDGGWLLVMVPDASRWDVAAVYSPQIHEVKLADAGGVRAAFAAQCESGTIGDWFPDLAVVLEGVLLEKVLSGFDTGAGGQRVEEDAREVAEPERARAVRPSCSEIQNAEMLGNGRGVLKFRTGTDTTRGRLSKLDSGQWTDKTGQNSARARGMDSSKREELKGKLHGNERDFYYVASSVLGAAGWNDRGPAGRWSPNGVRWMRRWQAGGEHRRTVLKVFSEMLSADFVVTTTAAAAAEELWKQIGGQALDGARFAAQKI